jgi:hypothetical protein
MTVVRTSLVILMVGIQTFCLIAFVLILRKTSAATKQSAKAVKEKVEAVHNARNLVIGTICTQIIVSLVFLPTTIVRAIQWTQTFMGARSWEILSEYQLSINWPRLYRYIKFGDEYQTYANSMFSMITIIVHLLTCPAYRRGARRYFGRVFRCCCCKSVSVNHTTPINVATKSKAKKTKDKAIKSNAVTPVVG